MLTVGKWRQRFTTGRVDALYDEPKPGAPRTLSDADVESILVATLESKPKGRTHWSTPQDGGARWRQRLHRGPHLAHLGHDPIQWTVSLS